MHQRDYRPSLGHPVPVSRKPRALGAIAAFVMIAAAGWGIVSRHQAGTVLKEATETAAVPVVGTVVPKTGEAVTELVLPGTVQAFVDSPIYARTGGYLKSFKADIGAQVRRGQVLAEIDTPEIDDQLRQAEAELVTAKANQTIAQSTAARWLALVATDSVTRQETDEKVADAKAKDAVVASAAANVSRLRELQRFSHVVAPFDGIISARKTDVGSLINAGSGQGVELFHMVDRSVLRIYVQVPQSYAATVSIGQTAQLKFAQFPGRNFPAKLVRTADAIDPAARTLTVEFQVDNSKGELLPGSYTEVHFTTPVATKALRVPINALIFRGQGLQVAKVGSDGKVAIVPVILGRDMGIEVELTDGVAPDDKIILNPPDSLIDGQTVRIAEPKVKPQ